MTEPSRKLLIAGNWKCYKTAAEAVLFIQAFRSYPLAEKGVDVALAPTYPALEAAVRAAEGSGVRIAAQNVFWEPEGAYTGEVSVGMLKAVGVSMVILGHSERRQYFGETDETVNKRLQAALAGGLTPIFCVGESLTERESGRTLDVIGAQIEGGLAGIDESGAQGTILAYEPVWAIGTGRTATPEIAQEVHAFIRSRLAKKYNNSLANQMRILYGGSVKPDNAAALMAQPDIDGALVGGASLKADVFWGIVNA